MRPFLPYITTLLSLFALAGCSSDMFYQEAKDLELPEIKPVLAVSALLNPAEATQYVYVGRTNPIQYNEYVPIEWGADYGYERVVADATVVIKNQATGATKTLVYDKEKHYYSFTNAEFPIEEGGRYELRVTHGTLPMVYGECEVPTVAGAGLELVRIATGIMAKVKTPSEPQRFYGMWYDYQSDMDEPVPTMPDKEYSSIELFSSYQAKEGVITRTIGETDPNPITGKASPSYAHYWCILLALDANAYDFYRYRMVDTDDPFATPVTVRSNVIGGQGVIGAVVPIANEKL